MSKEPFIPPKLTLVFNPEYPDEHEREICKRYWELSPDGTWAYDINKLAKQANSAANGFGYYVGYHCQAYSEMVCACGVAETHKFEFRENIDRLRAHPWACKACRKKRSDEVRETNEALRKAAEEGERVRRENWRRMHSLGEPRNPQTMHLRFVMYWYALLRRVEEPWIHGIPAVASLEAPWIGDEFKEEQILRALKSSNLLYIDPESPIPNEFDADFDFSLRHVRWRLSAPEYNEWSRRLVIDAYEMMPDPLAWPPSWRDQYVVVFEEVAWMECWRFWQSLHVVVDEEELKPIVCEALTVLSAGQVAWIMWGAANYATRRHGHRSMHKIARSALESLCERLQCAMENPPVNAVRPLHAPQGFATIVTLNIMSGTDDPWDTVSMRDVYELLRPNSDAIDASQDESDE